MSFETGHYYAYVEYPKDVPLHEYGAKAICVEVLDESDDTFRQYGGGDFIPVRRNDGRSWVNETLGGGHTAKDRLARPAQLVAPWHEYIQALVEHQTMTAVANELKEQKEDERRVLVEQAASYFAKLPASSGEHPDLEDKIRRYLLTGGIRAVSLDQDEIVAIARRFKEMEEVIRQNALVALPDTEEEVR